MITKWIDTSAINDFLIDNNFDDYEAMEIYSEQNDYMREQFYAVVDKLDDIHLIGFGNSSSWNRRGNSYIEFWGAEEFLDWISEWDNYEVGFDEDRQVRISGADHDGDFYHKLYYVDFNEIEKRIDIEDEYEYDDYIDAELRRVMLEETTFAESVFRPLLVE